MAHVEKTTKVDVPVAVAYNEWTQFEKFPLFMEGVKEVRQLDERTLRWRAEISGKEVEWDAAIVSREPFQRIAWCSTSGAKNAGSVTFHAAGPAQTEITLHLDYEPGVTEKAGSALGVVSAASRVTCAGSRTSSSAGSAHDLAAERVGSTADAPARPQGALRRRRPRPHRAGGGAAGVRARAPQQRARRPRLGRREEAREARQAVRGRDPPVLRGIRRAPALGRGRRRLHRAAERHASRLLGPCRGGRSARAVREAPGDEHRRLRRHDRRRRGERRAADDRLSPALRAREHEGGGHGEEGPPRRPALLPLHVQHAGARPEEHPP